ncbi:regulatory protein RecX [Candidatus Daviesbacteria bacterium]|nr:regulatory protein RecX [Candidatus Daviesbacteria bacterium]
MEQAKLLQKIYRLLSQRVRSEKEIRDYLKRKKADIDVVEKIIDQLKQMSLIDDGKFAKDWVESRRRSRQKGIKALKIELLQKGIERQIIEEVISREILVVSETQVAERALEMKMRVWKNFDQMNFKKKAIDFLLRKGFEYEVVKGVIDKFLRK